MTTRYFRARGKVQNVMFRQTLMRAAQKRSLEAGATNLQSDRNAVSFTLKGDATKIQEIIAFMQSGKELNNWGARVDDLKEEKSGQTPAQHEVNTANVDKFNWAGGVEMYL